MNENALAHILDNLYADRINTVAKQTILLYSESSELEAQPILLKWADEGHLKILKNLSECGDAEPCIRLLSFILPNPNRPD